MDPVNLFKITRPRRLNRLRKMSAMFTINSHHANAPANMDAMLSTFCTISTSLVRKENLEKTPINRNTTNGLVIVSPNDDRKSCITLPFFVSMFFSLATGLSLYVCNPKQNTTMLPIISSANLWSSINPITIDILNPAIKA